MNIGKRIRQRRIELNLSQDELAKKMGYKSRSSINKIELSRDLPISKVEMMAKILEIPPSNLMGWESEEYTKITSAYVKAIREDALISAIKTAYKKFKVSLDDLAAEYGVELVNKALCK